MLTVPLVRRGGPSTKTASTAPPGEEDSPLRSNDSGNEAMVLPSGTTDDDADADASYVESNEADDYSSCSEDFEDL